VSQNIPSKEKWLKLDLAYSK